MAVAHEKQGCTNGAEFLAGLLGTKKSAFPSPYKMELHTCILLLLLPDLR